MPSLAQFAAIASDETSLRHVADERRGGPRLGVAGRIARLLPAGWRLLRDGAAPDEAVRATDGRVELRSIPARVVACTAVKGQPGTSLETGLRRLSDYIDGHNLHWRAVRTARPVVQRPISSGRWLVEIALTGIEDPADVPLPRCRKVRIQAAPAETLAVIAMAGGVGPRSLAAAELMLHATMAERGWRATGPAMLRLRSRWALLPLLGTREVALPVAAG